ncbi:MAG TPA: hypothetical protein VHN99_01185 [Deinococcales bacterium]|nr:hypothetical protein [Deinococcales bacterium]
MNDGLTAIGVDFGLTNLDVVVLSGSRCTHAVRLPSPGPASPEALEAALAGLPAAAIPAAGRLLLAVTGGRHRDLPHEWEGLSLVKVSEPEAVGRGGLALAPELGPGAAALVVSAGSGTSVVQAGPGGFAHVTGSGVGGGTLLGLAALTLGTADPLEVNRLALLGDPRGVDSTLLDTLGGGVGPLPAEATAVNFARAAEPGSAPSREDIAAGLVNMVAQVIAVIALNAAARVGVKPVVVTGHLPDLPAFPPALRRVWGYYSVPTPPILPALGGAATALGAALAAAGLDGVTALPERGAA